MKPLRLLPKTSWEALVRSFYHLSAHFDEESNLTINGAIIGIEDPKSGAASPRERLAALVSVLYDGLDCWQKQQMQHDDTTPLNGAPMVCVIFSVYFDDSEHLSAETLNYEDDQVRTYLPERLDARLGNMETLTTVAEILQWHKNGLRLPIFVPCDIAKDFFGVTNFAKPYAPSE